MSSALAVCQWLHDLRWATALRESDAMYPAVETLHVLSLALAAGAIMTADLRLIGWVAGRVSLTAFVGPLIRLTWTGFALMAASGALLFCAQATKLCANPMFRLKLLLLLFAGINAAAFRRFYRYEAPGAGDTAPPRAARLSAALSLLLWLAVIASGRGIAYWH